MAISQNDVVNCYRYLLGREPESEDMVQFHMCNFHRLPDLVRHFLCSDEFERRLSQMTMEDLLGKLELVTHMEQKDIPYLSVLLPEGLFYVFDSGDVNIGQWMLAHERNYACDLVENFFRWTDLYYGKRERKGCFLDVGGNIGTTSIYVRKVLNPSLKIIAFEPMQKNLDMFRVNCILNHTEDIEVIHSGIGNARETKMFLYRRENPGGSGIMEQGKAGLEDVPLTGHATLEERMERVTVIPLDEFLSSRGIPASQIDYLWIDVEGFESNVIEGAKDLLSKGRIPLMQEFNPRHYADWEGYVSFMSSIYDGFIDMNECLAGESGIHGIEELDSHRDSVSRWIYPQSNLFFF